MTDSEGNQATQCIPEHLNIPRLLRTEQATELDRYRFGITIKSIYYYFDLGRLCCAVLVKLSLVLRDKKLQFALIPLVATSPANPTQQSNEQPIEIISQFPSSEELEEVTRTSVSREVHMMPNLQVQAVGLGASGVGTSSRSQEDRSYKIALRPRLKAVDNDPVCLEWTFEDKNGIYYPSDTNVIIIVSKSPENYQERWFPFELRLQWQLKVDVHGLANRISRLVARPDKHEGWFFRVNGQYDPDKAKDALDDAKVAEVEDRIPKAVGLRAAVKMWKSAGAQR